jgi:hypothetical protein
MGAKENFNHNLKKAMRQHEAEREEKTAREFVRTKSTEIVKQNALDNFNEDRKRQADRTKDLALVTAMIIQQEVFNATLFQQFDTAYNIAQEFCKEYPHDYNWENSNIDFESMVAIFATRIAANKGDSTLI